MSKIVSLAVGAVGFVLGSRAGRGTYDKLAERAGQVRRDPRVQEKVGEAQQVARDKAQQAASTVGDKVGQKVGSASSSTDSPEQSTDVSPGPMTDTSVTDHSQNIGQSGGGPQGQLP